MSSLLKQLNDDDREAINHMIRRDAHTDLEIGKEMQRRLPKEKSGKKKTTDGTDKTEKALENIIYRYRRSKEFQWWLKRWENQDVELKRVLATQKQRFELLSNLVKDPDSNGMETLSKSLQARLLTLAAETDDDALIEGAAKNGWIKNVIRVIQEQTKLEKATAGEKAAEVAADDKLSVAEKQKRIREILQ